MLTGEDEKEGDTDDFTPPLTTASAENKTSRAAPEDLPDPSATVSANELVKSRVEKPPIAEVTVLPRPPEPVVDEPVDSKRDLAARFETAFVAGDYGTAEALIDEAIGPDAKNTDVEHARQSIAAHRELTEVIGLRQSRPDLMRGKRVKTALDKAAKAMNSGRPQAALAIAKRLRTEFERAARRRRH